MKLKIKKQKNNGCSFIKLYNEDRSYKITITSDRKVMLDINYNTDKLIDKYGYNCKSIGY